MKAVIEKIPFIVEFVIPSITEVSAIDGFDTTSATKVVSGIKLFEKFLEESHLRKVFESKYVQNQIGVVSKNAVTLEFTNKNVVFTGVRNKILEEYIIRCGGEIKNTINKNIDLVVCKDTNANTTKINTSKKLGLTIVDIQTLLERLQLNY